MLQGCRPSAGFNATIALAALPVSLSHPEGGDGNLASIILLVINNLQKIATPKPCTAKVQ
jgi:hypothetical protein